MPRSSAAASARAASVATAVLPVSSRSRPAVVDDGASAGTSTRIAVVGGIAARISSWSALLRADRMSGSQRGATAWSISSPTASNPVHRAVAGFFDAAHASAAAAHSDASARTDDVSATTSSSSAGDAAFGPRTTRRTNASAPATSSGLDASLSTVAAARWNPAAGASRPVVMGTRPRDAPGTGPDARQTSTPSTLGLAFPFARRV